MLNQKTLTEAKGERTTWSRRFVNRTTAPTGAFTDRDRTPTPAGIQTEEAPKRSKTKVSQVRRGTDATKWLGVEYGRYEEAHKVLLRASGGAERGIEGKSEILLRANAQASESAEKYKNLEK